MASPAYAANGGIGASDASNSISVPFPANISAGHILLLQLVSGDASNDHAQPSGFTSITSTTYSTTATYSWWWKRAAGTESGNLTCSRTSTTNQFAGIMSRWTGVCDTGTPFNTAGPVTGSSTSFSSSAITPRTNQARIVCLCNEEDNRALGTLAGGNYAENFDVANTTGDDTEFSANSFAQTTKAQEAARTGSVAVAAGWGTITLALSGMNTTTVTSTKGAVAVAGKTPVVHANIPTIVNVEPDTEGTLVDSKSTPADGTNYNIAATSGSVVTSFTAEITANKHVEIRWHHFWTGSDDYYWVVDTGWSDGQFRLKYYDGSYHELQGGTGYFTDGVAYEVTIIYDGPDVTVLLDGEPTLSGSADFQPDKTLGRIRHTLATNDIQLASYTEEIAGGPALLTVSGGNPEVTADTRVISGKGALTILGRSTVVSVGVPATVVSCTKGSVTIVGKKTLLSEELIIPCLTEGIVTVAGKTTTVEQKTELAATKGTVTITKFNASVNGALNVPVSLGTVAVVGYDAGFSLPTIVNVGNPTLVDSKSTPADSVVFNIAAPNGSIVYTHTPEVSANKHVDIRFRFQDDNNYWVLDGGWSDGQLYLKWYNGSYHNLDGGPGILQDGVSVTITINYDGPNVAVLLDGVPTLSGSADFITGETHGKIRHDLVTNDLELSSYSTGVPVVSVVGHNAEIGSFTYYMSATGTAANKEAATGVAHPANYMNLSVHNAETFAPGDTVVVSDLGGIYRGTLNPPSSGNATGYITYDVDGSPEFCGADLITGWVNHSGNVWKKTAFTNYITNVWVDGALGTKKTAIISLTANGHWYNDEAGDVLYLYDDAGDPDLHVTPGVEANIRDRCVNANRSYIIFDELTLTKSYYANLRAADPGSHCIFRNCTSRYSRSGVEIGESDGSVTFMDWLFEDNDCSYNAVMGLAMCYRGQDSVIRRNKCYQNDTTYSEAYDSTSGIKLFDNTGVMRGIDIYDNKCYENGRGVAGDTGGRGCGIWVDAAHATAGSPITVHHNSSYDNKGNGLFLELCGYVYAWGNVGWGNALNTGGDDAYCPASISIKAWDTHSVDNTLVFNNTFYGGRVGLLVATYDEDTCTITDCQFKNNIFTGWTEHGLTAIGGGANVTYGSGNVYDYNAFGPESNDFIRWHNTYCDTYDAYIAASSQGDHNVEADPAFKDAANDKFYLTSASPCIDAGTNLGATYDDGLDPHITAAAWPSAVATLDQDSWGAGWEVGAYVYDGVFATGAIAIVGLNATVTLSSNVIASCGKGVLTIVGLNPIVTIFEGVTVDCTMGTVAVLGRPPTVEVEIEVLAATGAVTVTAFGTSLTLPETVLATLGAVTVAALQPEIVLDARVFATKGAVAVAGKNPVVSVGLEVIVPCTKGAVAIAKFNTTIASEITTEVSTTKGAVAVAKFNTTIASAITTKVSATKGAIAISGLKSLIGTETAVLASTGVLLAKAVGSPMVWYTTKVTAAHRAVSVAGYKSKVSIVKDAVPATTGAVTVAAVTPAFACPEWKRTRVEAQSKPITVLGKAASIIAPIIATALGTVAVTGYTAQIHQARMDVFATKGSVAVAGYHAIIGTKVNVSSKGAVTVVGHHTAASISALAKATKGAITVHSHATVVNALPIWATRGQVLVAGHDPSVVAPFIPGFGVVGPTQTSKNYITYYQDWANHFPAEIARRWRQFLMDTFFIATPATIAGGTGNSIQLTTDVEITEHAIGQAWRFIASATNTGGTILDVNNIGPQTVHYNDQSLKGGEIVEGGSYEVVYDGNAWNLTNSSRNVTQLSARTWLSDDQELTHNTLEPIVWSQTSLYDDDNFFYHGGGGIESIIIPTDGRYKITGMVMFRSDAMIAELQVLTVLYLNGSMVEASLSNGRVEEGENDCGVHFEYTDIFQSGDELILYAREWNNMSENAYAQGDSDRRKASWWGIERLR